MNAADKLDFNLKARVGLDCMRRRSLACDYGAVANFFNVAWHQLEGSSTAEAKAVDNAMHTLTIARLKKSYKLSPASFKAVHIGMTCAEAVFARMTPRQLSVALLEVAARVAEARRRGKVRLSKT